MQNPKSFDYDQYFDGFTENQSLPGGSLEDLKLKSKKERNLKLNKSDLRTMLEKEKHKENAQKIKAI